MAVLLSKIKKIFTIISVAVFILNGCAFAFDSGFSDDFFNILKKSQKKEQTPQMLAAKEELKKRKIPASVDSFIKYVKKNDIEIMQIFVDAGFDVNTDFYTDYPIYYATRHKRYEAAKFLLENGANPNLGFNPPLIEAIKKKNPQIAHLLIKHGAKVNVDDFMSGNTILYTALKLKQYEIARDLIEHGARIDTRSKYIIERKNLYDVLKIDKNNF